MSAPVYIGDELDATGYRLAGAQSYVGDAIEDIDALLDTLMRETPLLLLGAGFAATLAPKRLHDLLRSLQPLVVVVPDIQGTAPPDIGGWLRGQLGMNA